MSTTALQTAGSRARCRRRGESSPATSRCRARSGESPGRQQSAPNRNSRRCRRRAEASQAGEPKASPFRVWRVDDRVPDGGQSSTMPKARRIERGHEVGAERVRREPPVRQRIPPNRGPGRYDRRAEDSAGRPNRGRPRRGDRRSAPSTLIGAMPQASRVSSWPTWPGSAQAWRSAPSAVDRPSRRCLRRAESAAGRPGQDRPRRGDRHRAPSTAHRGDAAGELSSASTRASGNDVDRWPAGGR